MIKLNWKIFIISLIGQFVLTTMLYLGLRAPKFLNFLYIPNIKASYSKLYDPSVAPIVPKPWDIVQQKLEQNKNDFDVNQSYQFVPNVLASTSDYDAANSYIAVNFDNGDVLAQKDLDKQVPIASLTKLMSAVVALDLSSPNEEFTVQKDATLIEPTIIGVRVGEQMSLHELLQAMLMTSANDAAQVVADGIDQKYGQEVFVKAMNDKAQFLGLKNTRFTNPQGFDNGSPYSSAHDLAVLTHYALTNYPEIDDIVRQDYAVLPGNATHHEFDLNNWNGLLDVYPGVEGVKIGNTDKALSTTIVLSERDGKKVLVVVLGAPNGLDRDLWASELLNTGFAQYNIPSFEVTTQALESKYATWKYFQ